MILEIEANSESSHISISGRERLYRLEDFQIATRDFSCTHSTAKTGRHWIELFV